MEKRATNMPSILIVEDHPHLGKALNRFLQDFGKMQVAAVVTSSEEALAKLPELKVDLALIDVSLPEMSGIELVAKLRQKYPQLPCLMLSGHLSEDYVQRSLEAGAHGYIIKDNRLEILEGIQQVLAGETYLSIKPLGS
jgi:DNA-binding NarL/FixJ family response regulator